MANLWPNDITETDEVSVPTDILNEQAEFLSRKTEHSIIGEIIGDVQTGNYDFGFEFRLRVPDLQDYRYILFSIYYDLEYYPLKVTMEEEIFLEFYREEYIEGDTSQEIHANTEEEFKTILKNIFSSKRTRKIINSLLKQVDSFSMLD